jgi:hypothetical protein
VIVGGLFGLLIVSLVALVVSCIPSTESFKPYTWVWMLFGTAGALIGHFI